MSEHGGAFDNGTVFKVTSSGTTTILHNFSELAADGTTNSDGACPQVRLIQAKDGSLYGTSVIGGTHGQGAIFKLTTAGTESVLYSFASRNASGGKFHGGYVDSALVQLINGTFEGRPWRRARATRALFTNSTRLLPATATIIIDENNTRLAWGASSYNVNETAGSLTVHVKRTVRTSGAVFMTCATTTGTARSGTDHDGKSATPELCQWR